MASGAGKAAQHPGPAGSAVNGAAADFASIDQELYDFQMHNKMCKKIAQLTKVRPPPPLPRRGAPATAERRNGRLAACKRTGMDSFQSAHTKQQRSKREQNLVHSTITPGGFIGD